jgi:predicted metal-binding protein
MHKKSLLQLKDAAIRSGACDAKIIAVETVKTAAWVRYKCQFGCSGFGQSLTCPPYSPKPEQTQKILDCYKQSILIHCYNRTHADISDIALRLETAAFLAGYYKALAFGAGPCRLCNVCNKEKGCRHAEEARPSMEACGIDVFATAHKNGYKIETLDSRKCKGNYFGLVLIK